MRTGFDHERQPLSRGDPSYFVDRFDIRQARWF
jgi:hypothetical protein